MKEFSTYIDENGVTHTKAQQEVAYQAKLSAEAAESVRTQRDSKLAETDWVTIKSLELGKSLPVDWANYRQSLRDITEKPNFPFLEEGDWPSMPA